MKRNRSADLRRVLAIGAVVYRLDQVGATTPGCCARSCPKSAAVPGHAYRALMSLAYLAIT